MSIPVIDIERFTDTGIDLANTISGAAKDAETEVKK